MKTPFPPSFGIGWTKILVPHKSLPEKLPPFPESFESALREMPRIAIFIVGLEHHYGKVGIEGIGFAYDPTRGAFGELTMFYSPEDTKLLHHKISPRQSKLFTDTAAIANMIALIRTAWLMTQAEGVTTHTINPTRRARTPLPPHKANDYHIIDLRFTPRPVKTTKDYTELMDEISRHAPRYHAVRAHWRHCSSGKLAWVRQHFRGSKEGGVIDKHYELEDAPVLA